MENLILANTNIALLILSADNFYQYVTPNLARLLGEETIEFQPNQRPPSLPDSLCWLVCDYLSVVYNIVCNQHVNGSISVMKKIRDKLINDDPGYYRMLAQYIPVTRERLRSNASVWLESNNILIELF